MISKFTPLIFFAFFIFGNNPIFSQNYFQPNEKLEQAYINANSLRINEAQHQINDLKQSEAQNLLTYHIENYIDFYKLLILEEAELYEKLLPNKDIRLEKLANGPKDSPYYLYSQAEIELQWALIHLKFENYFRAFNEAKKAHHKLIKNQEKFPNFIANKKSLGLIHALVGTLPSSYQWGVKIMSGIEGDLELGKKELESVINYSDTNNYLFAQEASISYAFLLFYLTNDKKQAWKILEKSPIDYKRNLLGVFVKSLIAYDDQKFDLALELLNERPKGKEYLPFYLLDYYEGSIMLNNLDENASQLLNRFVNNFKGNSFLKKAYQRLLWHDLIFNEGKKFGLFREKIIHSGGVLLDDDKGAHQAAIQYLKPHPVLLKARLLYDGGNFRESLKVLENIDDNTLNNIEKQEYYYRLGRINQQLKQYNLAINWFKISLATGKKNNTLYACKSALELGHVFESLNNISQAKHYYKECLEIRPENYRNSLHNKAKIGLQRVGK